MAKRFTPMWLVALLISAACSSAGGFTQVATEAAGGKPKKTTKASTADTSDAGSAGSSTSTSDGSAYTGTTTPASGGVSQDSENTKTTAPVQVAGAFLTTICGPAEAVDKLPAVSGQDAYGCAVTADKKTKYSGLVALKTVNVATARQADVVATMNTAPAASRWHSYFYLDQSRRNLSLSYGVTGSVDGVAVKMTSRAPDPAGCASTSNLSGGNLGVLANASANNTSAGAQRQFATLSLNPDDVLSWQGAQGLEVKPTNADLGTCPFFFEVYYEDLAGNAIGQRQGLYAFGAGQQVPKGAASVWLSFIGQTKTTDQGVGSAVDFVGGLACPLQLTLTKFQCN